MKRRKPRNEVVSIEELAEGVRAETHPAYWDVSYARIRQDHVSYFIDSENVSDAKEAGRSICEHFIKGEHEYLDVILRKGADKHFKENVIRGALETQAKAHTRWTYGFDFEKIFNICLTAGVGVLGYKIASWYGAIGGGLLGGVVAGHTGWRLRNFLTDVTGLQRRSQYADDAHELVKKSLENEVEGK